MSSAALMSNARNFAEDSSWMHDRETWASKAIVPDGWTMLGPEWHRRIAKYGASKANEWLREHRDNLQRGDLYLACSESDLTAWADAKAKECQRELGSGEPTEASRERIERMLEKYGIPKLKPKTTTANIDDWLPIFARYQCKRWWRRQARVLQVREVEAYQRRRGTVAKYRQAYCSDWTVRNRAAAADRNREALEAATATNDLGDVYQLAELADLGTANQQNRRNELMTRIRGFEEVAEARGHVGEFWTFTTPSAWHRMRWIKAAKKAAPVDKWNGATPREAQAHLCEAWAKIRAQMAREEIRCYGFRIAEPHHDGTPHWHLLLFFRPDQTDRARTICRHYLLDQDSPTEAGATVARFQAIRIDPVKGTAAGYVAKYVAKNIDGAGVRGALDEADEESGLDLGSAALRVRSWASAWGLRQFQQIGGPSVTVWRELRRLWAQETPDQSDLFDSEEAMHAGMAADAGDWAAYVEAMGGPLLPRDCRPLKPAYWIEDHLDTETGELVHSYAVSIYGDTSKGSIFGLLVNQLGHVLTRLYRWTVEWGANREPPPEWQPVDKPRGWLLAPEAPNGRLGLV